MAGLNALPHMKLNFKALIANLTNSFSKSNSGFLLSYSKVTDLHNI